jgi:uncharacterized membrane protein
MIEILKELIPYIVPVVAVFVAYFVKKWAGITIQENQLRPIIAKIIEIIMGVELTTKGLHGHDKKMKVELALEKALNKEEKSLLKKAFGTVGQGVEYVFQTIVQPNLVRKAGKLLDKVIK